MLHIGLTGGIASGKSTVARIFASLGAVVIDLDQIAHEVMNNDPMLKLDIESYFGPEIIREDKTVDRKKLGELVFGNPEDLKALNDIVHPHVTRRWREKIETILRNGGKDAIVVSDVPLLFEAGLKQFFDLIILVYIPTEEQVRRLGLRDGLTSEEAQRRLSAQMPIEEKKKHAQVVIDNQGDLSRTEEAARAVWVNLLKLAREESTN
jgi:dephospho-CoA kinase